MTMTANEFKIAAERTMRNRLFQLILTQLPSDESDVLVTIRHDANTSYVADQHIGPLSVDSRLIDDALNVFGLTRQDVTA